MKSFFSYAIAFLFIFIALSSKVSSYENESILDKSQIIIANKYAERFCSAKADHFFEGLDNEKTLKYSYFQYIGLLSKEMYSKDNFRANSKMPCKRMEVLFLLDCSKQMSK